MATDSVGLSGQVVLVTGGTGNVGWGIAHAARAAGAHLILPTRSTGGGEALRAEFPDADVVVTDVGGASGATELLAAVERRGRLDHVCAPLGAWWQRGASLEQPVEELTDLLGTYATAQFRLLRTTADALRASGGSYTLITGAAGEHIVPGTGLLVVAVRSQYALADVLRHELADDAFRFNEVRIMTRVEREERLGVTPSRLAGEAFVDVMTGSQRSALLRFPATSAV